MKQVKVADDLLLILSGILLIYEFVSNYRSSCFSRLSLLVSIFMIAYSIFLRRIKESGL